MAQICNTCHRLCLPQCFVFPILFNNQANGPNEVQTLKMFSLAHTNRINVVDKLSAANPVTLILLCNCIGIISLVNKRPDRTTRPYIRLLPQLQMSCSRHQLQPLDQTFFSDLGLECLTISCPPRMTYCCCWCEVSCVVELKTVIFRFSLRCSSWRSMQYYCVLYTCTLISKSFAQQHCPWWLVALCPWANGGT